MDNSQLTAGRRNLALLPAPRTSRDLARRAASVLLAAILGVCAGSLQADTNVPATFVLPSSAGDASKLGFVWRVHQVASIQPNDNDRTEAELAGLLGDNIADPNAQGIAIAPSTPPSPSTAPISFDISTVINLSVFGGQFNGNFGPDDQMPGLPNAIGGYENAAAEILTWLDLPAGAVTLGVNSDDGFRMTIGASNPSDKFAVRVGEFNGGRPAADSIFTFNVAQAGIYAARCTWEQACCDANIEIFSVQADGSRVLVNDRPNGGIKAYRAVTTPLRAYARKVTPAPGAVGVRPDAPIVVELVDGATAISSTSVKLSVDGTLVTTVRSKSGNVTTTTYNHSLLYASGSQHSVAFTYTEGTSVRTVNWTFTVGNYVGPNGNLYEVVLVPTAHITWPQAKVAAENRTFAGVKGHLATITTAEEDVYLEQLRQVSPPGGGVGQLWVGGYQIPNSEEPGGGWTWINNEGPIPGANGGAVYANWYPGQPDNFWTDLGGSENYLAIGIFNQFGWNDDGFYGDGRLDGTLDGYVVEYERVVVPIDIKPGTSPNPVYLDAPGKLPVAILSTATFNANTVDPATVKFGRKGTEASVLSYTLEDVNKDGRKDLVCQFNIQDTGLRCGDTAAVLMGNTTSGFPIKGSDSIQILRCPPYALSPVLALQDVHQRTDIYLKINTILAGRTAPTVAQNLYLKSFDIFGKLRWTKTLQNVPLTPSPSNTSTANLQYSDMEHGQNVKTQMEVKDSTSGVTQVLRQEGRVLFRPDLAVDTVTAPSQANIRQIVNIFASVKELKGDLGATATVSLMDGNNVIDVVNGFSISALGNVGVAFSTIFQTVGTHQMKLVIGDVSPGDFDSSNNEKTFAIEVIQPSLEPVFYCASYSHSGADYNSIIETPYWISTYRSRYTNEYTSETLYIPAALSSLGRVTLKIAADGVEKNSLEVLNFQLYNYYNDGCNSYSSGAQYLDDGVVVFADSYQYCSGYQQTYVSFVKYGYSTVYFSSFYDKVWGTTVTDSFSYAYPSLLNAGTSVGTRFIVEANARAFGGDGTTPLYSPPPYESTWDYFDYYYPDYHYTGFYRETDVYGYNCDVTTP